MATRNRSAEFLKYRKHFMSTRFVRRSNSTAGLGKYDQSSERSGLIDNQDVVELTILPPNWVDFVDDVEDVITEIKQKVATLEKLHKKHMPGFDGRTQEEEEIEQLTNEVTKLFHAGQAKIRNIGREADSAIMVDSERVVARNIQTSLAARLQELSTSFRKQQTSYMKKLKGWKSHSSGPFSVASTHSSEDDMEMGFTIEQLALVEDSDTTTMQREREIHEIARSINELAGVFRDLQQLVIDQGTLLDRIDYNVEIMTVNVQAAARELDEAERYQTRTQKRKIILLLLLLIFGLLIVLFYKL